MKDAPKSRQQWRRRRLPAIGMAMPMTKTTGCEGSGSRTRTHASGKAMAIVADFRTMITRQEPASGESDRVAGFCALRTIWYSGEKPKWRLSQRAASRATLIGAVASSFQRPSETAAFPPLGLASSVIGGDPCRMSRLLKLDRHDEAVR